MPDDVIITMTATNIITIWVVALLGAVILLMVSQALNRGSSASASNA